MKAPEIPQPKFKVGEVVFVATWEEAGKRVQCPDCLGQKEWKVTTATEEFSVPCRTCQSGFGPSPGYITKSEITPVSRRTVIGTIEIMVNPKEQYVTYVCQEGGYPKNTKYYLNGTIHKEDELFHTEDEAMKAAKRIVVEERKRRIVRQKEEQERKRSSIRRP